MTEHTIRLLYKGEALLCSGCKTMIRAGSSAQLIVDSSSGDDERIEEVLCQICSDKRGE